MRLIAPLLLLLLLMFAGAASAAILYVDTDGSGDYNCDGTDDHIEINYALDNTSASDTVHINASTYNIDNIIWVNNSDTTFEGDGATSIIRVIDNAANPPWTQTSPLININNDSIIMQNLKIDGNYDNQTLPGGFNYLDLVHINGDHIIIRDSLFVDGRCDAIDVMTKSNISVEDNYFTNIGHESVTGGYSNSTISGNIVYLDTDTHGCNAAFRLYNGDYNIWQNNNISRKSGILKVISSGFLIHSYNDNSNSHGLIENNTMSNQYAHGILFDRGGSSPTTIWDRCTNYTIRNNIVHDGLLYDVNYSNGMKIYDTHWNNFTIENNVIYDMSGDGIWIGKNISNICIKNNIITKNDRNGIVVWGANGITTTYSDVYNNIIDDYNGTSAGIGCISVNPAFADPTNNDFHLNSTAGRWNGTVWTIDIATSPCVDAGDISDDYSTEPAPNGAIINMGAYGNTDEASKSSWTHSIFGVYYNTTHPITITTKGYGDYSNIFSRSITQRDDNATTSGSIGVTTT